MSTRAASPALVAVRAAVRDNLGLPPGATSVLVACSGGPDSLALAGATAWVAQRAGVRSCALVVDHGLQDGSAEIAAAAVAACHALGIEDTSSVRVRVEGPGGPEAAAREARYAALRTAAESLGVDAVLLGHTLDDQAETVLLRLTRGSGARSLSAMAPVSGLWRRPLLGLRRSLVHAAAVEQLEPLGLQPWADPHNSDERYLRVRARRALGVLVEELGEDVVDGLGRTARLARADADALDAQAAEAFRRSVDAGADTASAAVSDLAGMPDAIRWRVLRQMAVGLGAPAADVTSAQVLRLDAFVVDWHGQGPALLPAGIEATRAYGRLSLRRTGGARRSERES